MKFKGHGHIWNPERNKMLCTFKDGEYKTDDEYEITMLKRLGYEFEGEQVNKSMTKPAPKTIDYDAMTLKELRCVAQGMGIKGYLRMSKADLFEKVKG